MNAEPITIDELMELDEVPDTALCPICGDPTIAIYFVGNQYMCTEHGYFERLQ